MIANNTNRDLQQGISTVNFHLLEPCNMACKYCFVANLATNYLTLDESSKIVRLLAQAGFKKINFAGGEPMMYPNLHYLIRLAKEKRMTTSIVTNGTMVTDSWLKDISEYLDFITISIDSADPETHKQSGRTTKNGPLTAKQYLNICRSAKMYDIRLKINTVVTSYNCGEDMTGFIEDAAPERWKIMQALRVDGQNDSNAKHFEVTDKQFRAFVERHSSVNGVKVVPEDNDLMTGSYVMVDPLGHFFDNTKDSYTYSRPILQVGVQDALQDVKINPEKFFMRGGKYD